MVKADAGFTQTDGVLPMRGADPLGPGAATAPRAPLPALGLPTLSPRPKRRLRARAAEGPTTLERPQGSAPSHAPVRPSSRLTPHSGASARLAVLTATRGPAFPVCSLAFAFQQEIYKHLKKKK